MTQEEQTKTGSDEETTNVVQPESGLIAANAEAQAEAQPEESIADVAARHLDASHDNASSGFTDHSIYDDLRRMARHILGREDD